jgi:cation transport ATPase
VKATARRISQSRPGWPAAAAFLVLLLAAASTGTARAEVKRLQFPVSGMRSPLASRGVEEAIRTLSGVARVSADLGTGRVEVEAESQKSLNLQEVRTRAARAGYPVAGDLDVLARGRFDTGAEGRITFKVAGTSYAWQVLESATLLEMIRSHPGLRGEFIAGFRLFEKPPWNRPAISLREWEAVASATPAAAPHSLRPQTSSAKPPAAPAASSKAAAQKKTTAVAATSKGSKGKAPAVDPAAAKKKRRDSGTPPKP